MELGSRTFYILGKLTELGATPLEIVEVLEKTGDQISDDRVYEALKAINPDIAEQFRKEMSLYVWRTDLRREPFDRKRIVKSLTRETGISKSLAEKIAKEVENRIRNSDLSFLTSTLIRELVLIKLIEYGMEDAYRKYARLGVPVHDLRVMLKRGDNLRDALSKRVLLQYTVLYLFPKDLAENVFEGYVSVGGAVNPFVPYAATYYTRISEPERWFEGLARYMTRREFVDVPSIYVPNILEEEHLRILKAMKNATGAILWSTQEMDGVVTSETPVYSFGSVPEKKVLDVITVNVEKIYLNIPDPIPRLERIATALEEYQERKKEFVRAGNLYIRFEGMDMIGDKGERVLNIFDDFTVLHL